MTKRVIIRDGQKNIVSILFIEEDSKLSYRKNFTVSGTNLINIDLYLKDNYIGSVQCWKGTVEESIMIRNEDGMLVEKEV